MGNDLTIYNEFKEEMKTGDGLGFNHFETVSQLIVCKTKGDGPIPLSHFGGLIRFREYEERRRFSVEAMSDGFFPRILSDYIKDYEGHIYWYPLKDEWNPYRIQIGTTIMSMFGVGYNFLGVAKQLIMKTNANTRRLFCSQAWQIGLQNVAPQLCNNIGGKTLTPAGMWKLGTYKDSVQII